MRTEPSEAEGPDYEVWRREKEEEEKTLSQAYRSLLSLWVLCELGNIWQPDPVINKVSVFLPVSISQAS